MSTGLTMDQQIRVAALNAAIAFTKGADLTDNLGSKTLEISKLFEEHIRGEGALVPSGIRIYSTPGEVWMENGSLPDLTGCEISVAGNLEKHTHLPQQHRDGKMPWCRACGLDRYGRNPGDDD